MRSETDQRPGKVKVRLRLKPWVGVAGETMWASPVSADESGGTFSLENNSFYACLGVGDIVRAAPDGDGILQVTDVVMPSPAIISAFHWDWRRLSGDQACAMADAWRQRGASWTEASRDELVTIWNPEADHDVVLSVLEEEERAGRGQILEVLEGEDRKRELQSNVEFELETRSQLEPTGTNYRASQDPYWSECEFGSRDFIEFVQWLADFDDVAARCCEQGEYEKVLDIITFMTGVDPRCA